MKTITKRIEYLDLARGFGMLAVIWGHIQLSGWSCTLVYAFDIPLFFFLSGMMYNQNKLRTFKLLIKRMLKNLIIPYFIFSIVSWILWFITFIFIDYRANDIDFSRYFLPLLQTFLAQGSGGYLIHNVPLWFVSCLCIVQILYFFISKFNNYINLVLCSLAAWVGYMLVELGITNIPWNIESALSALLFFSIGNIIVKNKSLTIFKDIVKDHKTFSLITCIIFIVIFIIGGLWNGHISLGSNLLGNNIIILYIVGLCGTLSILIISAKLDTLKLQKLLRPIKWIGKNSFYFMAIHMPIKFYISLFASKILAILIGNDFTGTILFSIIIFTITLVLSSIAVIFINIFKNKFNIKII